jgi:glycosyltransferase 2 family protein
VVGILAVIYFSRELVRFWPSVVAVSLTPRVVSAIAVAVFLLVLSGLIDAWGWGWLLRGLSMPVRSREAMGVFLVSQFAKYVPGNVGQHVGRLALARTQGMPYPTVLLSIVVENGFALGAGAFLAGASLAFGITTSAGNVARPAWLLVLVISGWFIGAILLRWFLAHPPAWLRRILKLEHPVILERSLVAGYFVIHVTSYVTLGTTLVLVVFGLSGGSSGELWRVAFAAMAGWFAGYLVPGVPAGLGVREATLTALLTPLCGPAVAVSSALLWRSSGLLADVVLFLIGLGLRALTKPVAPSPPAQSA